MTAYDSRLDTYEHIAKVRDSLICIAFDFIDRANIHDNSKLTSPEVEVFNEYTPKLKDSTYGSDEYKAFLVGMGKGLRHHYQHNDHHPEHFEHGVADMDLIQVIEMLADWRAATQRHADGDLARSIEINAERFGYGDEFKRLLINTASRLGWINDPMLEVSAHDPAHTEAKSGR